MKIIDWYIIRQFLINFVIVTMVFMMLFVLVDLIIDLDEFLEAGRTRGAILQERWSGEQAAAMVTDASIATASDPDIKPGFGYTVAGTIWTTVDYYGPMALLIYVFLSGLLVTAAMGFTFTTLVRNREILAMISSGVSMYRLAAPVLVVGCLLNLATLPIQEAVIPNLAEELTRGKNEIDKVELSISQVPFTVDNEGNLLAANGFDVKTRAMTGLTFLRRENGNTIERITADAAEWDEDGQVWLLTNGQSITPTLDEGGSVLTQEKRALPSLATSLTPKSLLARRASIYQHVLSSAELLDLSDDPSIDATKILHSRFSMLVVNVLVLVMGLPFFMLRLPTNLLMQTVKAAGICIGAWATGLTMQMGAEALNPVAASWLPVAVYLPVSAWLLQKVKT